MLLKDTNQPGPKDNATAGESSSGVSRTSHVADRHPPPHQSLSISWWTSLLTTGAAARRGAKGRPRRRAPRCQWPPRTRAQERAHRTSPVPSARARRGLSSRPISLPARRMRGAKREAATPSASRRTVAAVEANKRGGSRGAWRSPRNRAGVAVTRPSALAPPPHVPPVRPPAPAPAAPAAPVPPPASAKSRRVNVGRPTPTDRATRRSLPGRTRSAWCRRWAAIT